MNTYAGMRLACLALVLTVAIGAEAKGPAFLFIDHQRLADTVAQARAGREPAAAASRRIIKDAEAALKLPRLAVVDKTQVPPSGDKHDYLSLAPYCWPDPAKPDGLPWMARDGEVNPMTRGEHTDLRRLQSFLDGVHDLALAFLLTDEARFADRATAMLDTWFVAPATRMNPHLKYGQGVPGKEPGRPAGIIETSGIDQALLAIEILARRDRLPPALHTALDRWFDDYLHWLRNDPLGKAEGRAKNNHSVHYDTQVVAILLHLGRCDEAIRELEAVKTRRIAVQIAPDGGMPAELARTKSLSYSIMNLRGFTRLARLGQQAGVDLWRYATPDGRGIQQAYRFLAPYADGSQPWTRKQIADPTGMYGKALPALFRHAAMMMQEPRFHPAVLARAPEPEPVWIILYGPMQDTP